MSITKKARTIGREIATDPGIRTAIVHVIARVTAIVVQSIATPPEDDAEPCDLQVRSAR